MAWEQIFSSYRHLGGVAYWYGGTWRLRNKSPNRLVIIGTITDTPDVEILNHEIAGLTPGNYKVNVFFDGGLGAGSKTTETLFTVTSNGILPTINSTVFSTTETTHRAADVQFWVYRELPNKAPAIPSFISVPTTVNGGSKLSISWGSSSDVDDNLSGYKLERSVNGGSWTRVYSGSSRSYIDTITKGWNTVAYRVCAYDSEGAHSGYTTSANRTVINNTAPTISGTDSNLGDKNLGFVISYQVDDMDAGDSLVVTEKLNGLTIKTINGAPRKQDLEIEITNGTLYSLSLNSENTIEIKVDDQKGGIAYRRYTFRRTNTAPIISNEDQNLGQKIEPFSIDFSASDNEGNVITIKTYLDGIKKEEYQVEDGATNTFTISSEDWYRLGIGNHSIKIEAIDEHGAIAIRNYTFTRYDDKIKFTLKNPIETDIAATKILVTPTWAIPIGANAKVEVCNNGYDEEPTWEDITSQVSTGKHYMFINDVKTADKWGIDIRFTIEKGTATEECVIYGFGGAFE
ncbi:hypothetical protein [Tissierella sp.]|uniref:hypothetical protein n=1 Tax=Tissierella sp. TaxID=41274 RepID=UPI003061CA64